VRVTTALCATRRDVSERRCKDSASGLSQQSGEAEGSLIPEARVRVRAALTRAGRAGTARRSRVRSARRRGVTRVNQWLNPLKRDTGSNLADQGRTAVHAGSEGCCRRLRSRPNAAGGEATGKACGENRGARTAGVDGVAPRSVDGGEGQFLAEIRGPILMST
jgi:hypothetical protein